MNQLAGMSLEETYLYQIAHPSHPSPVSTSSGVTWHFLSADGVTRLPEIGPFDTNEGRDRLRRGDVCYLAYVDDRLAHYSWVQRSGSHPILDAGRSKDVGQGEFWIHDCRTAEWARGQGIYPATLACIVNEHFQAGHRTAWIYTSSRNTSSQRGIERAGFNLVSIMKALRLGQRYFPLAGQHRVRRP